MADFVYANVSLPADKSDKVVLAGGEDPLKNVVAADYNAITAALKSARSAILAMSPGATVPGTLYAQPSDVPAGTAVLMGRATDASGSVAVAVDNSIGFTNTNARLLSIRNLGTERVWFDKDGQVTFSPNSGIGSLVIKTNTTDVGITIKGNRLAASTTADVILTGQITRTAGLLASFQNNSVEKANIDFNGVGTFAGLKSSSALVFSKRTTVADIAYTALITDYLISYTSITAARVVTLPTAVGNGGLTFIIKDESGSASGVKTISVLAPAGQSVDGTVNPTTVVVVNTAFGAACLYSNGTNWFQLY